MSRSALIDTNILLDACMSERPDWAYAVMLLDEIAFGKLDGYICSTSLKDGYYVLTKYAGKQVATEFVQAALDSFTVLSVDETACRIAIRSNEPDFEDGIIRACAEQAQVDFIISRDEKAFLKSPVRRLTAREYADLFCEVHNVNL